MTLHRTIDTIPVLVKAGGIIPMQAIDELSSRTDNPTHMELRVFCGAEGCFELYEDDGVSMGYEAGDACVTKYELNRTGFIIHPAQGNKALIPAERSYLLAFYGVSAQALRAVLVNGVEVSVNPGYDEKTGVVTMEIECVPVDAFVEIQWTDTLSLESNHLKDRAYEIINRAQIPFATKEKVYWLIQSDVSVSRKVSTMLAMPMDEAMKSVLTELLLHGVFCGSGRGAELYQGSRADLYDPARFQPIDVRTGK